MHDARVEMKDGTVHCAPIWLWRPSEGFMTLVGDPDRRLYFRDVAKASHSTRNAEGEAVVDLIERARREGWNGQ